MCVRRIALLALACALPLSTALACGPDFPQNLLEDRKASLLDLPEGTFDFEVEHLLPKPDDRLRPSEESRWDDPNEVRAKAEAPGLGADELAKVKAMRAAPSPGAAAAAGTGLAPELLEYTLGAIAFKAGDMATASAHFQRVLALSPEQRPRRGLWALWMKARAQLASGNTDGAFASFALLRERVQSRVPDPLGLGVASFGEQARVQWHRGNVAGAVALYAAQAAHGSDSGRASLLFVARSLLAHPDLLDRALDDPLSQRLLAAYFYARSDEFAMDWPRAGTDPPADAPDDADATTDPSTARKPSANAGLDVAGFLDAVQRHGVNRLEGADRLAAGAYRAGRYPLAAQFAAKSTAPLAAWVRAKLAMRAGDEALALREYAEAAKAFPIDESWTADTEDGAGVGSPLCRVESERGVLALSRGEYLDAMARLYAGAREHWPDAAYVAERVLTVGELKDFVDRNVPAVPKKPASPQGDEQPASPPEQLRALLARRLMREGRDDEAVAYFDEPALQAKAMELIAARAAANAWSSNARAQAIFKQAIVTRRDGMDLLGTELGPDFAVWGGAYGYDDFPLQPATYVGFAEPGRTKASAPIPNQRYHYRYAAANLAEQAAGLVPERSQAYAAMMCQATAWVIDTDPKRAAALYGKYVRVGAHVGWAAHFGRACPQPDFSSAAKLPWRQFYWNARHMAKRAWPFGLIALVVGIALVVVRRRRRAKA